MGDQLVKDAAVALQRLLTSPNFTDLDKAHAISHDLKVLTTGFRVKEWVLERVRLGRANVASFIEENVALTPDKDAIWCQGRTYSWSELSAIVDRLARWFLDKGVRPGDQFAIMQVNTEEFIFSILAITKLGAVPCMIDWNLRDKGLKHVLSLHKLSGVITNTHLIPHLAPVFEQLSPRPLFLAAWNPDSEPLPANVISMSLPTLMSGPPHTPVAVHPLQIDALGYVLYTSGTTGLPKGVPWPVSKVLACAGTRITWECNRDDRVAIYTPLYHGAAMTGGFLMSLAAGATMCIFREFSASKFWQRAIDSGATRAVYVGEITRYLLNQPPTPLERQHNLRKWNGVGLRPELWVEFKKRFCATTIFEYYSQTEAPVALLNIQETKLDGSEPDAGIVGRIGTIGLEINRVKYIRHDASTGKPYINPQGLWEEVQPGDVGEMVVRVDGVATSWNGYFENADATSSKEIKDPFGPNTGYWYGSGDIFLRTVDGAVSFKDRTGDTFRWKGENVATTQVELVLTSTPKIAQANVYGVKVPHHDGKAGMAALVVEDGFSLDVLAQRVVEQLPPYAWPVWLRLTPPEKLQVSAIFKLQKVALGNAAMDPSKVDGDKLFMFDQKTKKYLPFGEREYAQLVSVRSKL